MKSLLCLYRFGPGPSSSHTIAPSLAAISFTKHVDLSKGDSIHVSLHGSLALTGEGHGTEKAISMAFPSFPISFCKILETKKGEHPNSFEIALCKDGKTVIEKHYASLGGGELLSDDDLSVNEKDIYPFEDLSSIKDYMKKKHLENLKDFALEFEEKGIDEKLMCLLDEMFESVRIGLTKEGPIDADGNPRLSLSRAAKRIHASALSIEDPSERRAMLLTSYAYAVAEGNACGEKVVTAPTCGNSGILPAVLYYCYNDIGISKEVIRDSLFPAGVFGNIVKQNASIAGAIGGCQAEVGTATSMAAVALSSIFGLSLYQQEYAAECAMEHFLGLSCDPVDGYVIIPCIERNGVGALRAYESYLYAKHIAPLKKNQVSFDDVTKAMKMTGDALSDAYKETAEGGLAEILKEKCKRQ